MRSIVRTLVSLSLVALAVGPWAEPAFAGYRARVVATNAVSGPVDWLGFTYTEVQVLPDGRVLFAASDGSFSDPQWFATDNAVWLAEPGQDPQLVVREGMSMPQFPGDTYGELFYVRQDADGVGYVEASRSASFDRAGLLRLDGTDLVPYLAVEETVTGTQSGTLGAFGRPALNGGQALFTGALIDGLFNPFGIMRVFEGAPSVTWIVGERDNFIGEPTSEAQAPDLNLTRNASGTEAFILYGEKQDGFTLFRTLFRRPPGGDPVALETSTGDFVTNPVTWESLHLNAAGDLFVIARRYGVDGVWRYPAGVTGPPEPILVRDDASPGVDGFFTEVGGIAPRNDGSVLIFAETDKLHPQTNQPYNGIWLWDDGALTKVIATGDPAPGFPAGSRFRAIGGGLANGAGNLAFPAEVDDAGQNYLGEGLWAGTLNGFNKIVAIGESFEVAPGVNENVVQINMVGSPFSFVLTPPFLEGGSQDGLGGTMNETGLFCVEIRHTFDFGGGSTLLLVEPGALEVNSTAWIPDETPGDGSCNTGNFIDGIPECTWLAAIQEANATAGPDRIEFDIPGNDPGFANGVWTIEPTNSPPAITDPVSIDGTTQPGYAGSPLVALAGNGIQLASNEPGISLDTDASIVRGVAVGGFGGPGIRTTGAGNRIESCYIGLEPNGVVPNGNLQDGILVTGPGAVIGAPGSENVVAANGQSSTGGNQIVIAGPAAGDAVVQANLVGTDFLGLGTLPGSTYGISVEGGATDARIGGGGAGEGNLVAGMGQGISVRQSSGARILGNVVGLDGALAAALPNTGAGIQLVDAAGTVVGGETATPGTGAGNVVSGNGGPGIHVSGAGAGILIHGNVVGLFSADGNDAPNTGAGIHVENATGVWIGDDSLPQTANVISGNGSGGVRFQGGGDHRVAHARVGTGFTPGLDRPNLSSGIRIEGSDGNRIENSVIAENFGDGVTVETSSGTLLRDSEVFLNFGAGIHVVSGVDNEIRDTVFDTNYGLGIDLGAAGVLGIDPGDGDDGANHLQNAPFLIRAERMSPADPVTVNGYLAGTPNTQYAIAFFTNTACDPTGYGEGTGLWQEVAVLTDGSGVAAFAEMLPATAEDFLSATATDPDGNTSEFSNCLAIDPTPDAGFVVNSTGDAGDQNPGDGVCDTGGPLVEGLPECTLRAVIEETNAFAGIEEVGFGIPGAGPHVIQPASALPAITGTVAIDGRTQTGYAGYPMVRIDGSSAGAVAGLVIEGSGCSLRALEIGGFEGAGVHYLGATGGLLRGCVVGTAPVGAFGSAAAAVANSGPGVLLENASAVMIGAPGLTEGNVIAGNGGDGIRVLSGSGNGFVNNGLTGNGELAVDLVGGTEDGNGITANDPQDPDAGANGLQNFPVLTEAEVVNGLLTAMGTASGAPSTELQIDLYADPTCDASGAGEGAVYLGRTTAVLDGSGNGVFALAASVEALGVDDAVAAAWSLSATATGPDGTSEFSACLSPDLVPVVLASFTAENAADGVRLAWSTASETDHLGFHVLRRTTGEADWTRLTDDLLDDGPDYAFVDPEAPAGRESEYRLEAWGRDGSVQRLGSVRILVTARLTAPSLRALANPFRSAGTLAFALPEAGRVRLDIVTVTGRRVATLVDDVRPAGEHRVTWKGMDARGRRLAAGSYLALLRTPGETRTLQFVLLH